MVMVFVFLLMFWFVFLAANDFQKPFICLVLAAVFVTIAAVTGIVLKP